jgi:HSP20 family molecular chaperone IbpA
MIIKTKYTLYLARANFFCLASYKGSYSNEQSLNFVLPIMIILFLGIVYVMTQRSGSGFVSFILIGVAALTMFYWVRILKKMTKDQKPAFSAREQEAKNWVYDLIKGEDDFVFVAEVPGPEDKIMVRLIDGVLYIRGSANFSKEVPIEGSNAMQIFDFKYRNGVLTLRIKKD